MKIIGVIERIGFLSNKLTNNIGQRSWFFDIYKDLDRFDKVQKLRMIFFKLHTNNEEQMKIALRNPPCITYYTESFKNHFFKSFHR